MKKQLTKLLEKAERIVVMGIGNKLRRDDAAGVIIAEKLSPLIKSEKIKIIEAGETPENFLSSIEEFKPTHVIIVDTIEMKKPPGQISIQAKSNLINYPTISTHKPSPHILISYIEEIIGARVIIIGIQPKDINFGEKLTPEVKKSIDIIVNILKEVLEAKNAPQNN